MLLLEIWLSLLQFYCNSPQKNNRNSINKKMFINIIPKLNIWFNYLPPTSDMSFLINFQRKFKKLSENQQLLVISQMTNSYAQINNMSYEIRHVYSYVHESTFLQHWQSEMLKNDKWWLIQNSNGRIVNHLSQCLLTLDEAPRNNLIITLLQISQCSSKSGMSLMYLSMQNNRFFNYIEEIFSSVILQNDKKNHLMTTLHQSSLLIQHILLLHQRLEKQMILYLEQMKNQLNYQIDMEIDILRFFQK